jgi:Gas vesicle synthesis protein GvpL/GvpF
MPPLLLHAITPAPAEGTLTAPTERGLRGQALRVFRAGDLAGWATVWDAPDIQVGRTDLFDHHRIVQMVWGMCPCLPARFPTWLGDEDALVTLLEGRRGEIHAALERVWDRAELAVTVLWDAESGKKVQVGTESPGERKREVRGNGESRTNQLLLAIGRAPNSSTEQPAAPAAPAGPGRRYLESCRQTWKERDSRKEEARRVANALQERLSPWVVDSWYAFCPSDSVALSGALLVPADHAAELCEHVREMSATWQGVRTVVNGPWPPYTFSRLRGRELSVKGQG